MAASVQQRAGSAQNTSNNRNDSFDKLLEVQQSFQKCSTAKAQNSRRSRYVTLAATSVLTILTLWVDSASIGVPSTNTLLDFALSDNTLMFYVVGFATAFLLLSPRKGGKKGKCRDGAKSDLKGNKRQAFCASSGKASDSSSVVKNMAQALQEAASQGNVRRCTELITCLEGACKPSLPDVAHYNQVLRAYAKRGDPAECEGWLRRMREKGPRPNEQSYLMLMGLHGKAADVDALEQCVDQMIQDEVKPGNLSFSLIIHTCGRIGDVNKGAEWLARMKDASVPCGIAVYNSIIHACAINEDAAAAQEWYEHGLRDGMQPTVTTFTALIDVSAKCLDLDRAERWMDEMIQHGIEPNVISYSAMINPCAKVGDLKRAESWYDKMKGRGVEPNGYSYSALIDACARTGDVDTACSWLARAEASGSAVDAVVYGCVLNACGRAGDAGKAMEVFQRMKAGRVPTGVVIYSALARPYAYQGDFHQVEQLANEMQAEGIQMNDYFLYALLLGYSRARPRQAERASQAFCDAACKGMRLSGNDKIMKVLGASVGRARAEQLADQCGVSYSRS